MSWDQIKREWAFVCQRVLLTWGKLSEDDLAFIGGDRARFIDLYEQRYGGGKARAGERIDEFAMRLTSRPQNMDRAACR
ncbi:CsbD family protein [Botrimarina hoheduenensis]|uniref:CsbD-like domain-containing protein n=1 Tax=Botrimarina hoheduenensis TaxID=2528000 RepID=A0A5C5VRP3_9BACT|nr:CsbD family protein [Botrimarina hoheduenensis]TWT41314.1 hypothetical protein Pla111_30280 [Botrimarina hoheduenensis]